ncbi:MAG: alpha/beta fold hydrolase [Planctomycetota bacterium]
MSDRSETPRFRKLPAVSSARGILLWFPHAGGTSAAVVRQTRSLELELETWVAVLPAREERYRETAIGLQELVHEFAETIEDQVRIPMVLAGHSFGGLLAYLIAEELCQRRRSKNDAPLLALMPMAIAPPDRLETEAWSQSTDQDLVEHLASHYGAIPSVIRQSPEAMKQFLPVVRHDLRLMESYQHQASEPLPIDLVVCGGTKDEAANERTLSGWRRFTQREWTLKMFEGDHFFPNQHFQAITRLARDFCR